VLDWCLGIEAIEAVITVAFALAKAIFWDRVIISLESLTMGHSLFVTQEKFRHPETHVNSKFPHISVCAEPVGQGCDVVSDECSLEHILLIEISLHTHSSSFPVSVHTPQSLIHTFLSLCYSFLLVASCWLSCCYRCFLSARES